MTNYERIKAMSVEEMVEFLNDSVFSCEKHCVFTVDGECDMHDHNENTCAKGVELWLNSEVEE